jgi:hypothetical protein
MEVSVAANRSRLNPNKRQNEAYYPSRYSGDISPEGCRGLIPLFFTLRDERIPRDWLTHLF